jgi:hypothetical protein
VYADIWTKFAARVHIKAIDIRCDNGLSTTFLSTLRSNQLRMRGQVVVNWNESWRYHSGDYYVELQNVSGISDVIVL